MQPTQLTLIPDSLPPQRRDLAARMPEAQVAAAVTLLARLVANAAEPTRGEVTDDE